MGSKPFWYGVVVGVLGVWAYHAFLRPLPTPSKNA